MILNIADRRTRPHRWARVRAIVEATCYDNGVKDADQALPYITVAKGTVFDERSDLSLNQAIEWASAYPKPVTLFIYDDRSAANDHVDMDD